MEGIIDAPMGAVRENFPGFFDHADIVYPFDFEAANEASAEDGFPDVLDLSPYFTPSEAPMLRPLPGKSIFASAFLRKDVNVEVVSEDVPDTDKFANENDKRVSQMSREELEEAQKEILERFDEKTIAFLRQRRQKAAEEAKTVEEDKPKKVSAFRAKRVAAAHGEPSTSVPEKPEAKLEAEAVKNLEFFDPEEIKDEEGQRLSRLAANAVQMDLASKSYSFTAPRQMQAWISIFDKLKAITITDADELTKLAIDNMDRIQELYLGDVETPDGKLKQEFASDVNPVADGSWMLVPIRRVLDAVEDSRVPTADDVDIVRLSLLFMVVFERHQSMLLSMFGTPSDLLCRVAETFLLGPEVFSDNIIDQCIGVLLDEYFVDCGKKNKLTFASTKPIAKLDAFLPFFYELMKKYEEFGGGFTNFARVLFTMACMNNVVHDNLLLLINIWGPSSSVTRLCDISTAHMKPLIETVLHYRESHDYYTNSELFPQYAQLLVHYASCLRHERIMKDRNPGLFALATSEIGAFAKFVVSTKQGFGDRHEEISNLVETLRQATSSFVQI
uniref:RPAP1_N domain-containing protein n=1 Tax=Panagrellus redivivus TaxID=6233 RepID=A0A7E4VA40_PANRE